MWAPEQARWIPSDGTESEDSGDWDGDGGTLEDEKGYFEMNEKGGSATSVARHSTRSNPGD